MSKNIETKESLLSTIPIDGPRLIVTKDTEKIYYDTSDGRRLEVGSSSDISEEDVENILDRLSTFTNEDINNLIDDIWKGDPDITEDEKSLTQDIINSVWGD